MSNAFQESAAVVARLGGVAADTEKILSAVGASQLEVAAAGRELRAAQSELMTVRGSMLELRKEVQESVTSTRDILTEQSRTVDRIQRMAVGLIVLGLIEMGLALSMWLRH